MTSLADYAGRKLDAAVLRPGPNTGTPAGDEASLSLGDRQGAICAGIQKLAQNWLIIFLTQLGSSRFSPTRGSSFPAALRNGRIQTQYDLISAFTLAADEVAEQLTAQNQYTEFTDEQYASVKLLAASIESNARVVLRVEIQSAAGESRTVLFPVEASF